MDNAPGKLARVTGISGEYGQISVINLATKLVNKMITKRPCNAAHETRPGFAGTASASAAKRPRLIPTLP